MVKPTAKKMTAGKKYQEQGTGETTTSKPSTTTTTAMELSEEARVAISELQAIREDAQRDLAAVQKALQTAVLGLRKLSKQDIAELQCVQWVSGTGAPGKQLAMEAVCVMFRLEPVLTRSTDRMGAEVELRDYSDAVKELTSDPNFLMRLINYDKDNVSEATIRQVAPYLEMEGFKPALVRRSSVACGACCGWVRAMYTYHRVAKEVAPKRERLRQLQARLVELRGTEKEPTTATPEETQTRPLFPPNALRESDGRLLLGQDQAEHSQLGNEEEEL